MDAPTTPYAERQADMLQELAEIGLDLARDVAVFTKARLAEARESGWDGGLPKDPGAAFTKLAQCVRRTIALEAKLREGGPLNGGQASGRGEGLFASSGPPINLNPSFVIAPTPLAADRPIAEAAPATDRDPPETIAADLGPMLDPRERLFEVPIGSADLHAAAICQALGLDPARIVHRPEGWMVRPHPCDPHNPGETPLRSWRPSPTAILKAEGWSNVPDLPPPVVRVLRSSPNGAMLE